ncbi:MAG: two-component system chemotaxis response regulator CheB, partial [Alteromonadaceae bacterium]
LGWVTAVREIMKGSPTPILMFSSLTHQGAKATLEALDAGALDFLPKKFEDIARDKNEAVETLQQRIKAIARKRTFNRPATPRAERVTPKPAETRVEAAQLTPAAAIKPRFPPRSDIPAVTPRSTLSTDSSRNFTTPARRDSTRLESQRSTLRTSREPPRVVPSRPLAPAPAPGPAIEEASTPTSRRTTSNRVGDFQLLAIGTSTGGPVALQTILTALPQHFPKPILLIQHMPATFTAAFASRLNTLCKITVKEAADGDVLRPGVAYLAPGGKQMLIDGSAKLAKLKIRADDSARITYKPSVDITFGSAAKVFRDQVLAVVLTGMGADGREGARMLKKLGSRIWGQDEQSCVVYGMPQAVAVAGLTEDTITLNDMAGRLIKEAGYG